jgi:hypothetical protein
MRRIFSNPVSALAAGACLRFFFVLKVPGGSGDTALYEQLAVNWLKFHAYAVNIGGNLTPVDVRMPGYPAFLALIYWISGKTGGAARLWVMSTQVFVDLLTCLLIAGIAAVLAFMCAGNASPRRAFTAGLWLAALCPLTANYVAVTLTETWAIFLTAAALLFLCLQILRLRGGAFTVAGRSINLPLEPQWYGGFSGIAAGLGALFRPETPLVLAPGIALLVFQLVRRKELLKLLQMSAFMCLGCLIPLAPWAIRNVITLHEAQLLTPKNATLPGELVPNGFMAWEKTWLYRLRDSYAVTWKLNDEPINLEDVPDRAFDSPEEKIRVEAVLHAYNEDSSLTDEEDDVFGQLADERTARHPLRTYLFIPLKRAVMVWVTPRIELLPYSGHVFPLAEAWDQDAADQCVTIAFALINVFYLVVAVWGAGRLWRRREARIALVMLIGFVVLRTAFVTTLEAPEPRYVLECFPVLLAFAAHVFVGKAHSHIPQA